MRVTEDTLEGQKVTLFRLQVCFLFSCLFPDKQSGVPCGTQGQKVPSPCQNWELELGKHNGPARDLGSSRLQQGAWGLISSLSISYPYNSAKCISLSRPTHDQQDMTSVTQPHSSPWTPPSVLGNSAKFLDEEINPGPINCSQEEGLVVGRKVHVPLVSGRPMWAPGQLCSGG